MSSKLSQNKKMEPNLRFTTDGTKSYTKFSSNLLHGEGFPPSSFLMDLLAPMFENPYSSFFTLFHPFCELKQNQRFKRFLNSVTSSPRPLVRLVCKSMQLFLLWFQIFLSGQSSQNYVP